MQNWFHLFPKNTGLSLYAWLAFCLLPFYFIFRFSSLKEIIIGIVMIILFFTAYRLAFIKQGWTVYVAVAIEMAISIGMTLYFGYIYFSLFIAFFIGNTENKVGFFVLYIVHIVTAIVASVFGFILNTELFISQLPFIIIALIGVIIIPLAIFNRKKTEELEQKLDVAHERISQLIVIEERERIARDLHDTLGQKLSLIGLKSDLAGKLIEKDPKRAIREIKDIQQTSRMALNEVREMVSMMKSTKLSDEIIRVNQVIEAAEMSFTINSDGTLDYTPLYIEHVLSMCLKEAVTNVVKHSKASHCNIVIQESPDEVSIQIEDNGIGIPPENLNSAKGHGLIGIKERLEFVNGSFQIDISDGTKLTIKVPLI